WRYEPGRNAFRDYLDDGAAGRTLLAHSVEEIGPLLHRLHVWAEERVALDFGPIPGAAVNGVWPDLNQRPAHAHAGHHFAGNGTCSHAACGLACARPS